MCNVFWITFFSVSFIMKFVKLFVLLLLLLGIVFVLYQVEEAAVPLVEGFEEVPACQASNTRVPSCYASVQGDDYLDFYSDAQREDYILKTQVVTPICPNDPYSHMGIDLAQADGMITDASGTLWDPQHRPRRTSERSERVDASGVPFTLPSLSFPQRPVDPLPSNEEPKEPASTDSKEPKPSSTETGSTKAAEVSSNFLLNPSNGSKSNGSNSNGSNGPNSNTCQEPKPTCPPCPACERCPEPQVDCKRVVKYKDQQYPVPLIADFSAFTPYG
jgi:hypothetical protein